MFSNIAFFSSNPHNPSQLTGISRKFARILWYHLYIFKPTISISIEKVNLWWFWGKWKSLDKMHFYAKKWLDINIIGARWSYILMTTIAMDVKAADKHLSWGQYLITYLLTYFCWIFTSIEINLSETGEGLEMSYSIIIIINSDFIVFVDWHVREERNQAFMSCR